MTRSHLLFEGWFVDTDSVSFDSRKTTRYALPLDKILFVNEFHHEALGGSVAALSLTDSSVLIVAHMSFDEFMLLYRRHSAEYDLRENNTYRLLLRWFNNLPYGVVGKERFEELCNIVMPKRSDAI